MLLGILSVGLGAFGSAGQTGSMAPPSWGGSISKPMGFLYDSILPAVLR